MPEPLSKTVRCKACGRTRVIPRRDADGRPWGWYFVTVKVPPGYNRTTGKTYLIIGLFCSAACLAKGMEDIAHEEERHRGDYEHE